MIDFNIDIADLAQEFSLSSRQVDSAIEYCVEQITSEVYRIWSSEAKAGLGSSRNQYLAALGVEKIDKNTRAVFLNPDVWLPNAIEKGWSAFDMKPGFLKSDKVKVDKNGNPYLTIGFRFATPDAIGESDVFAGVMPVEIYTAMNKTVKESTKKNPSLEIGSIPKEFQIPVNMDYRNEMKSAGYEAIKDKNPKMTSIYEGMQKIGSSYVVFRRVSLKSDAKRWQHPGIEAKNFAQIAENKIESKIPMIVDKSIDDYLSNLGF